MKWRVASALNTLAVCALLLILAAAPGFAQTGSAVVKGTVTDRSQAVIPKAKVTLTNVDTNIVKAAESTDVGVFYFAGNQPGRYTLMVEREGMKKWTSEVVLAVGQIAVVNAEMEVGSASTVVEVKDVVPVIATEGSAIADVKDELRIHQIPLNGRTLSSLFDMVPGVEGASETGTRVNGMKVGSVDMTIDGISIREGYRGDVAEIQPGLDTVQEFRTETNGSSARYARPATVTVVTKSGTNQLHGSLFDTHRNNSAGLKARQRQDMSNAAPQLIRNEFGASAGGPVFIPKLYSGKDKTFWFFAFEGLRQHEQNVAIGRVPTDAMWGGDFSNIIDTNGVRTQLYDPMTTTAAGARTPFTGNIIPKNRINSFAGRMQKLTHAPTNSLNPFLANNINAVYPQLSTINNYTAKVDHRFSDKDSVMVRYTQGHKLFDITGGDAGAGFVAEGVKNAFSTYIRQNDSRNAAVTYNHLFNTNLFSELLLGVNRNPNHTGTEADYTNWASQLGTPNPFGASGWPTINIWNGFGGAAPLIWDVQNPKTQNMTSYVVEENLTWIKGKHSIQFGGRARKEFNNDAEVQQPQGSHEFSPDYTALYNAAADAAVPKTGDGFATMLLGTPTYLSAQYNRGFYYFRQTEIGLYFHDSFKVTPRLTLDLGVRWDKWTPFQEKQNRLLNMDVGNIAKVFQVVTPAGHPMESLPGIPPSLLASYAKRGLTWTTADKVPGMPSGLLPGNNTNFAPRLGLAYRLDSKTTLRGGFGMFSWSTPLSLLLSTSRTNAPLNLRYTNIPAYKDGSWNYALHSVPNQFVGPDLRIPTEGVVDISGAPQDFMAWDYTNWKDSLARTWNFTIEREIFKDTAIRLSYVGTQGRNLEQRYELNQKEGWYNYVIRTGQGRPGNSDLLRLNSNWNPSALNKTGYSNTHDVQFNLERRFAKGVAFQFFYVFTRSLGTVDNNALSSGGSWLRFSSGPDGWSVPQNTQLLGEPNLSYDQRLRLGYQNSQSVPAHRVRWNGLVDLPFGRGRHFGNTMAKALDAVIGGWSLTPAGSWRSGLWSSIGVDDETYWQFGDPTLRAEERLTMNIFGQQQRLWFRGNFDPTQATNVDSAKLLQLVPVNQNQRPLHKVGPSNDNWFTVKGKNGNDIWVPFSSMPYAGLMSWNQRGFFKGPGYWNADLGLTKTFSAGERAKVQLKADAFNFLNHPCDIAPDGVTGLQDLSQQANPPRMLQFTLRLTF